MPANYHSYDNTKRNSSSGGGFFKLIFILVLLTSFIWLCYYLYSSKERLLFYIETNKYEQVEKQLQKTLQLLKVKKSNGIKEVIETQLLLKQLIQDHPDDGRLYKYKADLYYQMFLTNIKKNQKIYDSLFFRAFINRYKFPLDLSKKHWNSAMVSYSRALQLILKSAEKNQVRNKLIELNLWGGKPYWQNGIELIEKLKEDQPKSTTIQLFRVLLGETEPEWDIIKPIFRKNLLKFFKGLYHLRTGNEPRGFSYLKKLSKLKDDTEWNLKNNSTYILSSLMKKQKKKRSQLAYYKKINLDEFLVREPWFLSEYNYILRFLGKKKKSAKLLLKYEKLINKKS